MAIEVKIPTILRTYTGGEKSVEAKGDTLAALIDDLDGNHPGLKGRLITDEGALHRFVIRADAHCSRQRPGGRCLLHRWRCRRPPG